MPHYIWVKQVKRSPENVAAELEAGLHALNLVPHVGEYWVVKLNLTYPSYLPGVVNSPIFVEGLCQLAREWRLRLTFIEGDGGNGSYSAQDAFDGTGVKTVAQRYGVECTSISEKPWSWRETKVAGHTVRLPYSPFFLRREYDRFITAPLFKNHIFTIVTLGMKNLWGCIPDAYRMYYHYILDHGIVALYKELLPDFSIFDGLIALKGRGPMDGKPLNLDLIMLSNNVPAGEKAALEIMGIGLERVKHLTIAHKEGILPESSQLEWLTNPTAFKRCDFVIDRSWLNHLSILVGKFPLFQRLVYHSPISGIIYPVVNRLRGDTAQTWLYHAKKCGKLRTISFKDP